MDTTTPQVIRDQLIQHYYSYLKLVKVTRNFMLSPSIYQHNRIDFQQFNQVTLIGALLEIKIERIAQHKRKNYERMDKRMDRKMYQGSMYQDRMGEEGQMCLMGIVQTELTEEHINNYSEWERKERKKEQQLLEQQEVERKIRKEKRRADKQQDLKRRKEQEWEREGLTEEQKLIKKREFMESLGDYISCPADRDTPRKLNKSKDGQNRKKESQGSAKVMRKMAIPMRVYRAYLETFNKIMQQSQQRKGMKAPLHAFTNLTPRIFDGQIVFCCGKRTTIIQLDKLLFQRTIEPMDRSLLFTFSRIEIQPATNIVRDSAINARPHSEASTPPSSRKHQPSPKKDSNGKNEENPIKQITKQISEVNLSSSHRQVIGRGPTLGELKIKLADIHRTCIVGIIRSINPVKQQTVRRDKQIQVQLIEDGGRPPQKQIGLCKIVIKYPLADEQNLMRCMQVGKAHLFINPEIFLSDSVLIIYRMRIWHKHIIKVSNKLYNVQDVYAEDIKRLKPSPISLLYSPHIFRNLLKIRATFQWFKMIYAKVTCQRCSAIICTDSTQDYPVLECSNGCMNIHGQLHTWAMIGVSDETGSAELSLENDLFFKYFDLQDKIQEFKFQTMRADSYRKGITIYSSATGKSGEYAVQKIIKNKYFQVLLSVVLHRYIQIEVIGVPKYDMNENFNALSDSKKEEFQLSLLQTKEYMRNQKVNLNGYLSNNRKGEIKYIPLIKVSHI